MENDVYDKYILAGKIAGSARDFGVKLVKEGVSLLEVADKIEGKIRENGSDPAFPMNISVNEVAAHFSPHHMDTSLVFKKGDVVKVDVGAHIDGYIADTAATVEVGTKKYGDMIKASRSALDGAIGMMKPDVNLSEVGRVIQETISSFGFNSIDNLTGHSLEKYNLHSGLSIPNVPDRLNAGKVKVDDVLAIEPFATDGAGHVISDDSSNIYRYTKSIRQKLVRDSKTRMIAKRVQKSFNTLPFAERWCTSLFSNVDMTLKKLLFAGCIQQYPQLIDAKKGVVTQAEHTVIITEDGCEVTT